MSFSQNMDAMCIERFQCEIGSVDRLRDATYAHRGREFEWVKILEAPSQEEFQNGFIGKLISNLCRLLLVFVALNCLVLRDNSVYVCL